MPINQLEQLSLVIGATQLAKLLETSNSRIVDVRSPDLYEAGHIPDAVPFNLKLFNISAPPVNGLLPSQTDFEKAMSSIGAHTDKTVFVYDEFGGPAASRFAWTLLAFNHIKVSMLNGGLKAWHTDQHPINTTLPNISPSNYKSSGLNKKIIVDREHILQILNNNQAILVDARSNMEFTGQDIRAERGGHIPGAINLNWEETKDPNNNMQFKSFEELDRLFQERGIHRDKEIICYCQSHQRSALLCILLSTLGYPNVKGYPGAWSDWGNQLNTPIEK